MKFIAGTLAAFLVTTSAGAADLAQPVYTKAHVAPASVPGWAGWYAGVNAGYAWRDPAIDVTAANAVTAAAVAVAPGVFPPSFNVDPKGGLIGGQIGYNWQSSNVVWGLETDLDWADIEGSGRATGISFPTLRSTNAISVSGRQKLSAFGTFRGRLGTAPSDDLLLYATAGLAYGRARLDGGMHDLDCVEFCSSTSGAAWKAGWTVGAGVEWAFVKDWSLKGEYLYYDLGSMEQRLIDPLRAPGAAFTVKSDYRGNIVRIGLNHKFTYSDLR